MLWTSCTGKELTVRMPQPVLTRCEYVGAAINWVIDKVEDISKMAQAVVNTQAAISAKNIIASAITSLTEEPIIRAHIHFIKGYHDSFFHTHFQWMKHVDKVTMKNGYLSQHMAIHLYVMHCKLNTIMLNWNTTPEFLPFVTFCNSNLTDPVQKELTLDIMPKKFFSVAHTMLLKHLTSGALRCSYH